MNASNGEEISMIGHSRMRRRCAEKNGCEWVMEKKAQKEMSALKRVRKLMPRRL